MSCYDNGSLMDDFCETEDFKEILFQLLLTLKRLKKVKFDCPNFKVGIIIRNN